MLAWNFSVNIVLRFRLMPAREEEYGTEQLANPIPTEN